MNIQENIEMLQDLPEPEVSDEMKCSLGKSDTCFTSF